jgi:hypothetical protein
MRHEGESPRPRELPQRGRRDRYPDSFGGRPDLKPLPRPALVAGRSSAAQYGVMTAPDSARMRVTIHLLQQTTVAFDASQLWPLHGEYARFGNDLPSLAEEVARRLRNDGYIGFSPHADDITLIPLAAVKRIDFSLVAPRA